MQLVWSRRCYNYIPIFSILLRAMMTDGTSLLRQPASLVPADFITGLAPSPTLLPSNAKVSPPSSPPPQRSSADSLPGDPQEPERLPLAQRLPYPRPGPGRSAPGTGLAGPDRSAHSMVMPTGLCSDRTMRKRRTWGSINWFFLESSAVPGTRQARKCSLERGMLGMSAAPPLVPAIVPKGQEALAREPPGVLWPLL